MYNFLLAPLNLNKTSQQNQPMYRIHTRGNSMKKVKEIEDDWYPYITTD